MRCRLIFVALNLVAFAAQAQQPASAVPATFPAAPAVAPAPAPPAPVNTQGVVGAAVPPSTTSGVMTLSDVARQAPADGPAPGSVTSAPVEVPAITPLDSNARQIDAARARMRESEAHARPALNIVLSRISTVGEETWAILWVRGQNRKVLPGARVLQYTVGEIRDDGVCLYTGKPNGKRKGACQQLVTFLQGV